MSEALEFLADLQRDARSDYGAGRLWGVYVGIVTNNQDPDNRARVKVKFPWLHTSEESWWARVAQFYAGKGRGNYWMPEVDDEVLVAFERGDFHFPYVVGSVWNGVDNVPGPGNPDGENNIKHIELRTGHKLIFDDTEGANKISLIDSSGNNSIVIDVAADTITMQAKTGDINIQAPAGSVNMSCIDLNAKVSNNAAYSITNHHSVECKDHVVTVGATQKTTVNGSIEFECPMTEVTAAALDLTSAEAGAQISTAQLTFPDSKLACDAATRKVGLESATIGAYQLNASEAGFESRGAFTVNAAAEFSTKGKAVIAEATGSATVAAGMVKADGNPGTVQVKGSVVTLN